MCQFLKAIIRHQTEMDLIEKLLKYDGVVRAVAPVIENIARFAAKMAMMVFYRLRPAQPITDKVKYTFTYNYPSDCPNVFVSAMYDYVEKVCGLKTRDFYYSGDETYVDPTNLGNDDFGIDVLRESKTEVRSRPITTLILYSTIHTREEFKAIIDTIVNDSRNIIVDPVNIIARNSYDEFEYMIIDEIPRPSVSEDVFIHRDVTDKIANHILTHKMGNYMLYGPPGTGKTTLIRQIASRVGATIISISLNDFTNRFRFLEFLSARRFEVEKGDEHFIIKPSMRFIIFEDFDTMLPATFWRPHLVTKDTAAAHAGYTFSDLLNILDGVAKINGMYTFWTTNDINVAPPSFYRSGRMSIREKVDLLSVEDTTRILGYMPEGGAMRLAQVISLKIDGVALTIEEIEEEAALAIPKVIIQSDSDSEEIWINKNTEDLLAD